MLYIFQNIWDNNKPSCGNYLQSITEQICAYIIYMHTKNCNWCIGKHTLSENIDNKCLHNKSHNCQIISLTLSTNLCKTGNAFSKEVQQRKLSMKGGHKSNFNCLRFLNSGNLGNWINSWTIEPRKMSTFINKRWYMKKEKAHWS